MIIVYIIAVLGGLAGLYNWCHAHLPDFKGQWLEEKANLSIKIERLEAKTKVREEQIQDIHKRLNDLSRFKGERLEQELETYIGALEWHHKKFIPNTRNTY